MAASQEAENQNGDGSGDQKALTDWSKVILAVIPGEVTAVYLGVRSTVAMIGQSAEEIGSYVPFVLMISIILLTLITPYFSSLIRGADTKTGIFVAASFFVWALNIDYDRALEVVFLIDRGLTYAIASYAIPILMIAWAGLAIPMFAQLLKGAEKPEALV